MVSGKRVPNSFALDHAPAVNTAATVTQAAAGAGRINVCTAISASIIGNTTAPAAVQVDLRLIDGAAGGATVLWEKALALEAVAGKVETVDIAGLYIEGTANTEMTLEFSAAGGANTFESVDLVGYVVGA